MRVRERVDRVVGGIRTGVRRIGAVVRAPFKEFKDTDWFFYIGVLVGGVGVALYSVRVALIIVGALFIYLAIWYPYRGAKHGPGQ